MWLKKEIRYRMGDILVSGGLVVVVVASKLGLVP